ncbi:MAG: GWxTD domain-containing protein [Bacteroidota bacterium]
MSGKRIIVFSICLISSLFFIRCSTSKPTTTSYSSTKKISIAKDDDLNAQFYLYKNTDTAATLFFMLNTEQLLYARLDTGLQFYASVKLTLRLYSASDNALLDSVSQTYYINKNSTTFFNYLNTRISDNDYNVQILITDLHRKTVFKYFTEIKLNNNNTRNNFLITLNDKLLFKPYAIEGNKIKIYHRKKYPILYVDVFNYNHSPAPPPFSNITKSIQYLPDSSFSITLLDSGYYQIQLQPYKYYHIRPNQSIIDGLTIFSIDSIFPNIKDAREMLYTSRYIMNKNEFERCNSLSNISDIKKCVDNFWIQIAGSKERAKEIIKNYYQRVIDANKLFTSYQYGWQTDRGMIYIIFGHPEDIQKFQNIEKWYYSINGQKNALVFNFYKNKNNPFTSSDYILERSDYYKDIWYIVVDKIRQGRLSTSGR